LLVIRKLLWIDVLFRLTTNHEQLSDKTNASSAGAAGGCANYVIVGTDLPEPNMLIVPKKPTRFRMRAC
jgi:hypothetical protein